MFEGEFSLDLAFQPTHRYVINKKGEHRKRFKRRKGGSPSNAGISMGPAISNWRREGHISKTGFSKLQTKQRATSQFIQWWNTTQNQRSSNT
jgi:hypothetical protein